MTKTALILFLAALAACSKAPPPAPAPAERAPFQVFAEGVGFEPACAKTIPMEWAASLPVPLLREGKLHYRVFFFGRYQKPGRRAVFREADGDAEFGADGKVVACSRRPALGRTIPDEPAPAKTQEEYDARRNALYAAIEETARLYAKGSPVSGAEHARIGAFAAEFAAFAGAARAADYRALSPDFWAWVEKNGGRAP